MNELECACDELEQHSATLVGLVCPIHGPVCRLVMQNSLDRYGVTLDELLAFVSMKSDKKRTRVMMDELTALLEERSAADPGPHYVDQG